MIVKLRLDDLKNEQEKKMDDMGNDFGGQASTSVGKNKTQTQCLMRCFNCNYLYSKQNLKNKIVLGKKEGT